MRSRTPDAATRHVLFAEVSFTLRARTRRVTVQRLLDEFDRRFAEYRKLNRSVLDLAVENTSLDIWVSSRDTPISIQHALA